MDARVIVITIMQKFGEKSVYFGWFMAISKGGLNQPPPHSSYIQKPRTIRVNIQLHLYNHDKKYFELWVLTKLLQHIALPWK